MSDKKQMIGVRRLAGPVVHTIGEYQWSEANGFTAEVDVETAAGLLTEPRGRFSLAPGLSAAGRKALAEAMGVEPKNIVVPEADAPPPTAPEVTVANIVGGKRAPDLAALGVTEARHLAGLDDEGIERLAASLGASREEVRAWAKQAANEVKNGK
jgi:predicted flap endonuclease-1-like 5' DNA nuclease